MADLLIELGCRDSRVYALNDFLRNNDGIDMLYVPQQRTEITGVRKEYITKAREKAKQ